MSYPEYGAGGIITETFKRFGTMDNHLGLNASHNLGTLVSVLSWNTINVWKSNSESEPGDFIEIEFLDKPRFLTRFAVKFIRGYRVTINWSIAGSLMGSTHVAIHPGNVPFCAMMNDANECTTDTVNYFVIDYQGFYDKVRITITDKDSQGTYMLRIGGLEFYEDFGSCTNISMQHHLMASIFLLIIFLNIASM